MLAEFSIIPVGDGISISSHVAKVAKIIDESGLNYRINPMATVVEGEIDEVFSLIKKCHQRMMQDVQRVSISITIDDRKDKKSPRMDKKLASVEEKIGKSLRK
ncbi:MAG: MTH1187 family thiamine-binding protein [Candidatus Omnitrophota bacterium]|nr:MAG: MTH1187 family thiamine-binding protein [Candidatus Omnitrophota bacterium]